MTDVYVAKSSEIAARVLGGEMMIMSARDSTVFTLNDVATVIWQAADGITSLREIVQQKICEVFDIGPAEALEDAQRFVTQLAEHGILILSEEPGTRG